MTKPKPRVRWKRTRPFKKQCAFSWMDSDGFIERCEEETRFGLYYYLVDDEDMPSTDTMVINLCIYHAVYQESIWVGGDIE